jgi:hypothetical protein
MKTVSESNHLHKFVAVGDDIGRVHLWLHDGLQGTKLWLTPDMARSLIDQLLEAIQEAEVFSQSKA